MAQRKTKGEPSSAEVEDSLSDGDGLEIPAGAVWTFPTAKECRDLLQAPGRESNSEVDTVYRLVHQVPIAQGGAIHVAEHFTPFSWLMSPRRAILFLQGSVHNGDAWSIPVPGYNATEMAAQRGMFCYTVDFLGSGRSFTPADGLEANLDHNVKALKTLIRYIRFFRAVPKVDLVGEGYGGIMATHLAADARRVNSCVMTNTLYKEIVGGPATAPEMVESLRQSPSGYFSVPPAAYDLFAAGSPPAVLDHLHATQPGDYPTPGMLIILGDPPFFDPSRARVPGLVLFGGKDPVLGPNDARYLAEDYGAEGARLMVNDAGGHAMRLESLEIANWFWTRVFNFIEFI